MRVATLEEISKPFDLPSIPKDNVFEKANKIIDDLQRLSSIEPVIFEDDPDEGQTSTEDLVANPPKKKMKKDRQ